MCNLLVSTLQLRGWLCAAQRPQLLLLQVSTPAACVSAATWPAPAASKAVRHKSRADNERAACTPGASFATRSAAEAGPRDRSVRHTSQADAGRAARTPDATFTTRSAAAAGAYTSTGTSAMRSVGEKPNTPLASRKVPHAHTAPLAASATVWLSPVIEQQIEYWKKILFSQLALEQNNGTTTTPSVVVHNTRMSALLYSTNGTCSAQAHGIVS